MINKNKILFIDDGKLSNGSFRIDYLKKSCKGFTDVGLINFEVELSRYFQVDKAGTKCKLLFSTDEYQFIFIHHSFNDPTLLPSNGINLIKSEFKNLLPFSGGNDGKNEILSRQVVYDRLYVFLEYFQIYGKWMPYCFKKQNYKNFFAKGLLEDLRKKNNSDVTHFVNSREFKTIERFIQTELNVMEPITGRSKSEIISFIENKIENSH